MQSLCNLKTFEAVAKLRRFFVKQLAENEYCLVEIEIVQFLWTNVTFKVLVFRDPQSPKKESNSFLPGDISQVFCEHILRFIKPIKISEIFPNLITKMVVKTPLILIPDKSISKAAESTASVGAMEIEGYLLVPENAEIKENESGFLTRIKIVVAPRKKINHLGSG
ncbi:hypothetical protein ACTXT7_012479 [Hymenolepis weldensis]